MTEQTKFIQSLIDKALDFSNSHFGLQVPDVWVPQFFHHTPAFIENYYNSFSDIEMRETLQCGVIPFAKETDRGLFCFDTNSPADNNEFKIVVYNREFDARAYPAKRGQFTFMDLLEELDERLEQWKANKN